MRERYPMATFKYYNGTQELKNVRGHKLAGFLAMGGIKSKHNRYNGFQRLVCDTDNATVPVTRMIIYKSNPSLHKCDSRCRSAKGHNCECSCGGEFHGSEA